MKLISRSLLQLVSNDYDYGYCYMFRANLFEQYALEDSSLGKLPDDIAGGCYRYDIHPELL